MNREALETNLNAVRERIKAAAQRAGRNAVDIQLVAVTKSVDAETTQALIELGAKHIAENRQQTAADKLPLVPGVRGEARPTLHFIGPLQRNKVKRVLEDFDVIHSVDSVRLAKEISKRAVELGRTPGVFVQIDVAGEEQKHGIATDEAASAAGEIVKLPGLNVIGLMCMAPYDDDPENARPYFRRLAELSAKLREQNVLSRSADMLSMGMSGDFEVAIEEGATHVRVGSALFEEV